MMRVVPLAPFWVIWVDASRLMTRKAGAGIGPVGWDAWAGIGDKNDQARLGTVHLDRDFAS